MTEERPTYFVRLVSADGLTKSFRHGLNHPGYGYKTPLLAAFRPHRADALLPDTAPLTREYAFAGQTQIDEFRIEVEFHEVLP